MVQKEARRISPRLAKLIYEAEHADDSASEELETVYHAEGSSTAGLGAVAIKALLESNGVAAVLVRLGSAQPAIRGKSRSESDAARSAVDCRRAQSLLRRFQAVW